MLIHAKIDGALQASKCLIKPAVFVLVRRVIITVTSGSSITIFRAGDSLPKFCNRPAELYNSAVLLSRCNESVVINEI